MFAVRPPPPMPSSPFDQRSSIDSYISPINSPLPGVDQNAYYGAPFFRSMPTSKTPQYAFPIQRGGFHRADSLDALSSYTSEHSLRRKTPNGTLAAGYDATPMDGTTQLPANKHVLVSSLPEPKPLLSPPRSALGQDPWQQQIDSRVHSANQLNKAIPQHGFGLGNGLVNTVAQGGMPWNNHKRQNLPLGFDSVLDQSIPLHQNPRYFMQDGSSIPTVLPATLHQFSRPTASAGPGLYGPYWPDGAFAPYRPAPFRDPRFYPSLTFDAARTNHAHAGPSFSTRINSRNYPPLYHAPHDHYQGGLPYMQYNRPAPQPHDGSWYNQHRGLRSQPTYDYSRNERPFATHSAPLYGLDHSRPESSESKSPAKPPSQPATPEFKEKTLAWAHRVYVDLLAILHQNRFHGHKDGSRTGSKPSIYPKPPRQPGSDFSASAKQSRSPPVTGEREFAPNDSSRSRHGEANDTSRPATAIYSPSNRHQSLPSGGLHIGPYTGSVQSFSDRYSEKYQTMRRSSAAGMGSGIFGGPDPCSTEASARAALDMLEHLCQESNGDWIDGMLLGGCLAYGLADYDKAMVLYQRILARDAE
ncbi:MAG: hypothetical protein Q9227_008536 [Pyrenula ochraceoflavens]